MTIREKIEKYPNHHMLGGHDTSGGMEQNYDELEQLCNFIIEKGINSFLEIGLSNGKLHEFIVKEMRLDAEGISPVEVPGAKMYVGKSQDPEILKQCREFYDMVFVDGDHSAVAVRCDYENFKDRCQYMAFHDITGRNDCEEVAKFWNLVKKWHQSWEFICSDEKIASGIGIIKLK